MMKQIRYVGSNAGDLNSDKAAVYAKTSFGVTENLRCFPPIFAEQKFF